MKRPNFEKIISLLEADEEFSLTEKQYAKSTGKALPKNDYYLKNGSALARIAKKYGYVVEVQAKTICLKKAN